MGSCPTSVLQLIEKFEAQADQYRAADYNETQVRIDFINPMFKALGRDMDNIAWYAESCRDVVHEDAIRIEGNAKAPDYAFRIGGVRKFFVQAKKTAIRTATSIKADHPRLSPHRNQPPAPLRNAACRSGSSDSRCPSVRPPTSCSWFPERGKAVGPDRQPTP